MKRPYKRSPKALESAEPRLEHAQWCLKFLEEARKHARWAGLGFTTPRITAAINSARGAVANAGHRVRREARS